MAAVGYAELGRVLDDRRLRGLSERKTVRETREFPLPDTEPEPLASFIALLTEEMRKGGTGIQFGIFHYEDHDEDFEATEGEYLPCAYIVVERPETDSEWKLRLANEAKLEILQERLEK